MSFANIDDGGWMGYIMDGWLTICDDQERGWIHNTRLCSLQALGEVRSGTHRTPTPTLSRGCGVLMASGTHYRCKMLE